MLEFNAILILGDNRKDVIRWNIITKHQVMDADKCGWIPEEEFQCGLEKFPKVVLSFSLKVKYSICIAEIFREHVFNFWDKIFQPVNLQNCYI